MAQPMICDGPDNDLAEYVITMIEQAEVKAFCLSCMADFCQGYLSIVSPDRLAPEPAPRQRKSRAKAAPAEGALEDVPALIRANARDD